MKTEAAGGEDPPPSPDSRRPESSAAATRLQKVYRSYRTRRRLADSAVIAEELWWKLMDFARLNYSTVSFFDHMKQEKAISRWHRMSLIASKVGQGLSKDAKALKLAFQHWIEAIDPRHRYGHNLHFYYEEWCKSQAGQPFFYWLDIGDGKDLDLKECPRSLLKKQCVKYMGPQERKQYEYEPVDSKILHKLSGEPLDTTQGGNKEAKWIFVMSTSRTLYAGQKKKGVFHHSSFLAGGATVAAGRFTAENGILKCIWAYSGHYRPSDENFDCFLSFLKEHGVHLHGTQILSSSNEEYDNDEKQQLEKMINAFNISKSPQQVLPTEATKSATEEPTSKSPADGGTAHAAGASTLFEMVQRSRSEDRLRSRLSTGGKNACARVCEPVAKGHHSIKDPNRCLKYRLVMLSAFEASWQTSGDMNITICLCWFLPCNWYFKVTKSKNHQT